MSTSFEDHMKIVTDSHKKTASAKEVDSSLLSKLAQELEAGAAAAAAPTAEGQVAPADTSVAGATPVVAGQTDAVAVPQEVIAGADPAEKPAGEVPAAVKPNEGTAISAGDGKVTDANQLHKTPEAVAEAAQPTNKDGAPAAVPVTGGEKNASLKEAEEIGRSMARSYAAELQKIALDEQYAEAVGILKEAELLDGYKINEPEMSKEASDGKSALEKIAEKQPLSKADIVQAAHEVIELAKQAEDADLAGREAAHEFVAELVKKAEGEAEAAPAADAPAAEAPAAEAPAAEAPAAESAPAADEGAEKVAAALKILREKGLLA